MQCVCVPFKQIFYKTKIQGVCHTDKNSQYKNISFFIIAIYQIGSANSVVKDILRKTVKEMAFAQWEQRESTIF